MKKTTLQNDFLKIGINHKGAEFANLQSLKSGTEYLWQADPKFWGRHSCILFPYIGKVFQDEFRIGEQTFSGTQHGFARDLVFEVVEEKADKVVFQLKSNALTLEKYPYQFSLLVKYVLEKNQLHIIYEVENLDEQAIYFSLGAHPAFNVPLGENEKRSDYRLEFEKDEYVESMGVTENGYLGRPLRDIFEGKNEIELTDELFDEDALIFKNLNSDYLHLVNAQGDKIWTFNFEGFPYLGIWSKNAAAPFVCIEPWMGVADKENADWDFREKEGVLKLEVGKKFECTHSVTIHK